jgi:hypothetical protein
VLLARFGGSRREKMTELAVGAKRRGGRERAVKRREWMLGENPTKDAVLGGENKENI